MPEPTEKNLPAITIFPNLNVVIRTPAGRVYRGRALEHPSQHVDGEKWYQIVNLNPVGKENEHQNAVLRQEFHAAERAGNGRPAYFPDRSNVEPLRLNLNRIPLAMRHPRNAGTLIGELWDADGLWTVFASPTKSDKVLYAGSLVPAKVEIARGPDSKISQYQQATRPGEMPIDEAEFSEAAKPQPAG